jgi:hypothetical protein
MGIKKSVFGSRAEMRGFKTISRAWDTQATVLAQTPWSAIFDMQDDWLQEQPRYVRDFFFKTSVDYVVASRSDGKPLMAIEFDGMGQGFNRESQYLQAQPTKDRNRKKKFDSKLEHARIQGFPLYIVGSEEFRQRDRESQITIVDGLIGYELGLQELKKRVETEGNRLYEEFSGLAEHERHERIQDWLIDAEFESHWNNSLIRRETVRLAQKIEDRYGLLTYERKMCEHLEQPALPEGDLMARARAIQEVERVGCRMTIEHKELGTETALVWMRNIGVSRSAYQITEETAELLCHRKLVSKL